MARKGNKKKAKQASTEASASETPLAPESWLLSELVEQSVRGNIHSAARFLHHFPPASLMDHLSDVASLRAHILKVCVGIPERTAERLDPEVAAGTLEAALDAGDTTPADVFDALTTEERVRHLPATELWRFLNGDIWFERDGEEEKAFMEFLLERAQHHELTHADAWFQGRGLSKLVELAPRPRLEALIAHAAQLGIDGSPFTPAEIRSVISASEFIEILGLAVLHETIVLPMGEACGFGLASDGAVNGKVLVAPHPPVFEDDLRWSTPPGKTNAAKEEDTAAS